MLGIFHQTMNFAAKEYTRIAVPDIPHIATGRAAREP
jgi:hypothetical protein